MAIVEKFQTSFGFDDDGLSAGNIYTRPDGTVWVVLQDGTSAQLGTASGGGPTLVKVPFTHAQLQAAWDNVPGDPVFLPDLAVSIPQGWVVWASGVAVILGQDDSAGGSFGFYTTGNVLVSHGAAALNQPILKGDFQGLASGDAQPGTWSVVHEPMYATAAAEVYPGVDVWTGDGSEGETLLWMLIQDFGLLTA